MSAQAEIDRLTKLLVKYNWKDSLNHPEVADKLIEIGPPAIPALMEVLRLPRNMLIDEPVIEEVVCQILLKMGEESIDTLLGYLTDSDGQVRAGIMRTLLWFAHNNPALADQFKDLFLAGLNDSYVSVREDAIMFVGEHTVEAAFDGLVQALYDKEDYWNARVAADALVKVGGKKAILPLCQALEYELQQDTRGWLVVMKVTSSIVKALIKLNAVHEVPEQTLLIAVRSKANSDVNEWARAVFVKKGNTYHYPDSSPKNE